MALRSFLGGKVFGEVNSDAPRLVALHGWGRNRHDFDEVLSGFPSIALDLPGFGASPPPRRWWSTAEYADQLQVLLKDLGVPVLLVGHSFGGRIAVQLAARHPELVHALVLTAVPFLPRASRWPRRYRLLGALHRRGLLHARYLERTRARYATRDNTIANLTMLQTNMIVSRESHADQLKRITCPVDLVWGDQDDVTLLSMAREAAAHLCDYQLHVVAGAGHLGCLTDPTELREVIRKSIP